MPRFSLGSHPPQQQQQQQQTTNINIIDDNYSNHSNNSTKRSGSVKSWWKRIRKTFSSSKKQNFPGLSPDRPPLPPILGGNQDTNNNNNNTSNNNNNNNNSNGNGRFSSESNGSSSSSSRFTRAKRIAPQTESAPTSQRRHLRQSTGSIDDRTTRLLYTILEESDTIMTDSTQSRARPQSLVYNDNNNNDEKRISTSSNETDSSTTSSSSAASYHPPPVLPANTLVPLSTSSTQAKRGEPQFRASMIGDETKCRRKFVRMVQAAYNFQMEHKDLIPKEMYIVFNVQDNVQSIRLSMNDQAEYHKFCGNSQYIPPELSTHGMYNHGLADVWVLGISLYRMLVGKYPFVAPTDRKLFKKMLSADFSIPAHLSEDAKDLLRRMLAPDTTRASLDLVLFHPWLKPYKLSVPSSPIDNNNNNISQRVPPIITTTAPSSSTLHRPTTTQTSPQQQEQQQDQDDTITEAPRRAALPPPIDTSIPIKIKSHDEKKLKRILSGMMLLLVEGPYPPPKRPYQELAQLHTNHLSTNRPQRALAR